MSHTRILELLYELVPDDGVIYNIVDKVDLFRISNTTPRTPMTYKPSIIFLAQGHKRIFVGDDVYTYDPLHYLVLSVPLPLECETNGTREEPLLGLTVNIDPATIAEIMLAIDDRSQNFNTLPKGIYSAGIDNHLIDAIVRFLETLSSPSDKNFLGPMIVREIIYRVLCGEKGNALKALAYKIKDFFKFPVSLIKYIILIMRNLI